MFVRENVWPKPNNDTQEGAQALITHIYYCSPPRLLACSILPRYPSLLSDFACGPREGKKKARRLYIYIYI